MTLQRLAEQLQQAVGRVGAGQRIEIPLVALSTACLALGVPSWREDMKTLADRGDAHYLCSLMLAAGTRSPHVNHLDSWVRDAGPAQVEALQDCLRVVAGHDLVQLSHEEDVLGYVYGALRSAWDRSTSGSFYTPMHVAKVVAAMTMDLEPRVGQSFYDPTLGSGTMLIAAAELLRAKGRIPSLFRWRGQDIDGIACALAAVNFTYRGMTPADPMLDLLFPEGA